MIYELLIAVGVAVVFAAAAVAAARLLRAPEFPKRTVAVYVVIACGMMPAMVLLDAVARGGRWGQPVGLVFSLVALVASCAIVAVAAGIRGSERRASNRTAPAQGPQAGEEVTERLNLMIPWTTAVMFVGGFVCSVLAVYRGWAWWPAVLLAFGGAVGVVFLRWRRTRRDAAVPR